MSSKYEEKINNLILKLSSLSVNDFLTEVNALQSELIREKVNKYNLNEFGGLLNYLLLDNAFAKDLAIKLFKEGLIGDSYRYFRDLVKKVGVSNLLTILEKENLSILQKLDVDGDKLYKLLVSLTEKDIDMVLNFALSNASFYKIYKEQAIKYFPSIFYNIDYEIIIQFLNYDKEFVLKTFKIHENDYQRLFDEYIISDNILKEIIVNCKNENIIKGKISSFFNNKQRVVRIFNQLNPQELSSLLSKGLTININKFNNINPLYTNLSNLLLFGEGERNFLAQKIFNDSKKDNPWEYYRSLLLIDGNLDALLKIFGKRNLKKIKENSAETLYKLLASMTEKNVNKVLEYALSDNKFYETYSTFFYLFPSLLHDIDYNILKKYLKKDFKLTLKYFSISKEDTLLLFDDGLSTNELCELINRCRYEEILTDFFNHHKRAMEIFNCLKNKEIHELTNRKVHFPKSMMNTEKFFNTLKSSSIIILRNNINMLMDNFGDISMEKRLGEYYESILRQYDPQKKVFKLYEELYQRFQKGEYLYKMIDFNDLLGPQNLFEKLDNHSELERATNQIVSNIVIDYLFKDNIYNVIINLTQMLRYNQKLSKSLIDISTVNFYQQIINIDSLSIEEKIRLYYKLKDKRVDELYYDDFRRLKEASQKELLDALLKIEDDKYKSTELSEKYHVPVYDYRDKNCYLFIRSLRNPINEFSERCLDCYSLISNENSNAYSSSSHKYIYGFTNISIKQIVHSFESDAFSTRGVVRQTTPFINRIMTPRELVMNNGLYSEIQIKNKKVDDEVYLAITPSYVVAIEDITDQAVKESKRLNIPIVLIKEKTIQKDGIISLTNIDYTYAYHGFDEQEREARRK